MPRLAAVLLFAAPAAGHATMVQPMPRASHGRADAPSFPGAGANFPGCAGDACLWYSVGCFIGCPACSSTGKDMYPTPATNGDDGHGHPCTTPMEPTNNNASTRTNNPEGKSPHGDWTKYMPWRAPGFAPSVDPCGAAGAFKPSSPNPAEVPAGATQFQKGTTLPALKGNVTVWRAGGVADVAWAIAANHGGGYQYRLCPKSAGSVTEECFQRHVLPFASTTTTIRYTDGSRADVAIAATDVSTGTKPAGSTWRKNPIPMCNCDVGQGCVAKGGAPTAVAPHHIDVGGVEGKTCTADPTCANLKTSLGCRRCADPSSGEPAWSCAQCCSGCTATKYGSGTYCKCASPSPGRADMFTAYEVDPDAARKTPDCPTGLQFPNLWDEGYGDGGNCLYPQGPSSPHCKPYMWTMGDKVSVPAAAGDYTLSFRWDCEHTPQVWNQCADITVA